MVSEYNIKKINIKQTGKSHHWQIDVSFIITFSNKISAFKTRNAIYKPYNFSHTHGISIMTLIIV